MQLQKGIIEAEGRVRVEIESLRGVDPYTWLVDVLQRIDPHPDCEIGELTPRRRKELFAANPLRSDLHGLGKWRCGLKVYEFPRQQGRYRP